MTPPNPPCGAGTGAPQLTAPSFPSFEHLQNFFFALVPHLLPFWTPSQFSCNTKATHLLAWSHSLTLARPHPLLSSALRVHLFSSSHCSPLWPGPALSLTYRPTQLRCLAPQGARTSNNPPQTLPGSAHVLLQAIGLNLLPRLFGTELNVPPGPAIISAGDFESLRLLTGTTERLTYRDEPPCLCELVNNNNHHTPLSSDIPWHIE